MDKSASLTPQQKQILHDKGTETAFTGNYIDSEQRGSYLCRQCGLALFRADTQFIASCGWPSFDEHLAHNVKQLPDIDGRRIEIVCTRCAGHLGHVFTGEGYTDKNKRYCVNSVSIEYVADQTVLDTEEAILAAGCFWGVQYLLDQCDGILLTEVGYTGGEQQQPSYEDVCAKPTGHLEAVRVVFDSAKTTYQDIIRLFFEIHDFTQSNGQGPDIGSQYLSAIFYYNEQQKQIAQTVISELKDMHYNVATKLYPVTTFWQGEAYHQLYYQKNGKQPYCHVRRKIFC